MGGNYLAVARRRRRGQQVIDAEMKQAGTHPHHVHQGIHGTHLMEMHLLRRAAMHPGLGLRQALKHRHHPLAQGIRPGGSLQLGPQPGPMALRGRGLQQMHVQAATPQAGAASLLQFKANGIG